MNKYIRWTDWQQSLNKDEKSLVLKYYNRFVGTSGTYMDRVVSRLCKKGSPYQYNKDEEANKHINLKTNYDRYKNSTIIELNKSHISSHLFEKDYCIYYSSNGPKGLIAFDIDAKNGEIDALDYAYTIQDKYLLHNCSFIQSSTNGKGAYLYVFIDLTNCVDGILANKAFKYISDVVSDEYNSYFDASLDAIKGTFSFQSIDNSLDLYYETTGNWVRAPLFDSLDELNNLFDNTYPMNIKQFCLSFGIDIDEIRIIKDKSKKQKVFPIHERRENRNSLYTPGTTNRFCNRCLPDIEEVRKMIPWDRVKYALKRYRDNNDSNPTFEEFDHYYEELSLNTGKAKKSREERFDRLIELLGPNIRRMKQFNVNDYNWIKDYVNKELIIKHKNDRKITYEDLAIVQYTTRLATKTEVSDKNKVKYGMPLNRIAGVYHILKKYNIVSCKFSYSKSSYCKRILEEAGLIKGVDKTYHKGLGQKWCITNKDPDYKK